MPNYFADVIFEENNERLIAPMRYRLRRNDIDFEIQGIYNARMTSLESKETWKPLFMKKHGLIAFSSFYEWVNDPEDKKKVMQGGLQIGLFTDDQGQQIVKEPKIKKKLIMFSPKDKEMMWAPCLWSEWVSKDGQLSFKSFAIITDEPPRDVSLMGHDRCPIFLSKDKIDLWLNPQGRSTREIYSALQERESNLYTYQWVG